MVVTLMLVAAYLGSVGNLAPPAQAQTGASAKPIGYLFFLTVYPSQGASTPAVANLISLKKAYPQVPMVAVMNDGWGGGTSTDLAFASAINAMRAAGIVVLGYVYCIIAYGTTPGSRNLIGSDSIIGYNDHDRGMEQAIDAWHAHYAIDGIFFDNAVPGYPAGTNHLSYAAPGWPGHTLLQYYQAAVAYGKSNYGYAYDMANVGTVFSAMIGVVNSLTLEVYPHGSPLPSPTTLKSWTTGVGGTSADFSLIAWLDTTVPSVAYLSSIQGYVGFVDITDTNGQPSTSYQDALVANLNQLGTSTLTISITQSGSSLYWHISGLTPYGAFSVSETTSQGFNAFWNTYKASSTGTDSRQFVYGSGTPGDVVTLDVTDVATGRQASTSYKVQGSLSISITQSGSSLYWHISGLTPYGAFSVSETTSQGFNAFWNTYKASSTGTDSRQFVYGSGTSGDVITLKVTDTSTGRQASTSYTLP